MLISVLYEPDDGLKAEADDFLERLLITDEVCRLRAIFVISLNKGLPHRICH